MAAPRLSKSAASQSTSSTKKEQLVHYYMKMVLFGLTRGRGGADKGSKGNNEEEFGECSHSG